jgi:hypothetical protein
MLGGGLDIGGLFPFVMIGSGLSMQFAIFLDHQGKDNPRQIASSPPKPRSVCCADRRPMSANGGSTAGYERFS